MTSISNSEKEIKKHPRVIDFHSHVLPAIDDGSKSVEESIAMLEESYNEKIRKIVATPHFYSERMNLPSFLEKREGAINQLLPSYREKELPTLFIGAEVAFFPALGDTEEIRKLTIVGTNTLLIEMPFSRWSLYEIETIKKAKRNFSLNIVIAHIERYLSYQKRGTLEDILNSGIYIQSNGEFFINEDTRSQALKLLKNKQIQVLGSDMHNTSDRAQNIEKARDIIKNNLGEEYISYLLYNSKELLTNALTIEEIYNQKKEKL